MNHFVR